MRGSIAAPAMTSMKNRTEHRPPIIEPGVPALPEGVAFLSRNGAEDAGGDFHGARNAADAGNHGKNVVFPVQAGRPEDAGQMAGDEDGSGVASQVWMATRRSSQASGTRAPKAELLAGAVGQEAEDAATSAIDSWLAARTARPLLMASRTWLDSVPRERWS